MADEPPPARDEATALARERTSLALERTRIAAERTLMAWIRTSVSLIGFGFTIYKFFQYLREAEKMAVFRAQAPRNFGLALIIFGTLVLVAAAIEHRLSLKRLESYGAEHRFSLAFAAALVMTLVGVALLVSLIAHLGPF